MKKKLGVFVIIFAAVAVFLSPACLATGSSYQSENAAHGTELFGLLDKRCFEHYIYKLEGDEHSAEANTCGVIQVYVNEIKDLIKSPEAQSRSLTDEMDLLYEKGMAAGTLSWIYFSNHETVEIESVKNAYESRLSVIRNATNISFFKNGEVEGCYTHLLQSVYTEKIRGLGNEQDSDTVKAIISSAPVSMGTSCKYDTVNSNGEDGGNYKAFYEQTAKSVSEQRRRDAVKEELRAVYSSLYPDEVFDSSPRLTDFFYSLNTKSDLKDMNILMSETVIGLLYELRGETDSYQSKLIEQKSSAVSDATSRANTADPTAVPDLRGYFTDFGLELSAAKAKDSLEAYAKELANNKNYEDTQLEGLKNITAAYSDSGGIFDSASEEELEGALFRAKTECEWFAVYTDTLAGIEKFLGSGTYISDRAKEQHSSTAIAIRNGERGDEGDIPQLLAEDITKMRALVIDAEALKFETDHREILKKSQVTASDRDAISAAIDSAELLSDEAEALLSETLSTLGEKYKTAVLSHIRSHILSDTLRSERESAVGRLAKKLSELSATDENGSFTLFKLRENADGISVRSEKTKELFDIYLTEYLSLGTSYFTNEARETALSAADKLCEGADDNDTVIASASLELSRLAALERIHAESEGYTDAEGVSELLNLSEREIREYSDKNEISNYAERRITELRELIRSTEAKKADGALSESVATLEEKIKSLQYINDSKKTSLLFSLAELSSDGRVDIQNAADASAIRLALASFNDALTELTNTAMEAERLACLEWARTALGNSFGLKEDYSAENYARILELLRTFETALEGESDIEGYLSVLDQGISEIALVEDLLEEALRVSRELLEAVYGELLEKRVCYSAEATARLDEIYTHTLSELEGFTSISDAGSVKKKAEERAALMRAVPINTVYTSDGLLSESSPADYPDGYDMEDGYIGAVWAESGMPSDTVLTIGGADSDGISELIKRAAKKRKILLGNGGAVGRDILKLLRSCDISAAIDIDLGDTLASGGSYRVSLLLPDDISVSEIIGVVFLNDDGTAEFYEVISGESMIEFETTHFSSYYVVSKGAVSLMPWIICLSVIILCELALVIMLLIKKRTRKPETLSAFIPLLPLAVRYRPAGGAAIVGILGGIAIALAALIGYLAYSELKTSGKRLTRSSNKAPRPAPADGGTDIFDADISPSEEPMKNGGSSDDIAEATPIEEASETYITAEASDGEFSEELLPSTVPSISAEAAELLMSDAEASRLRDIGYEDREIYSGTKKAEINIDVISSAFEDGDTVTLNSLKEKGLIGRSVGHVKVLARGVLDKRLTVVAQDFSGAAIKMILLTGGEAIFTHGSAGGKGKRGSQR